jgi:hypothetical protein
MPVLPAKSPKLEKSVNSEGVINPRGRLLVLGTAVSEVRESIDCSSVEVPASSRLRFLGRPIGFLGE